MRRFLLVLLFLVPNVWAAPVVEGWIPSRLLKQGQVRLVETADQLQLEVLLHTRFMQRAVDTILKKERDNWAAAHVDAARYCEQLQWASQQIQAQPGRQSLLIVFSLRPPPGEVAFYTGSVDTEGERWEMATRERLTGFMASPYYVLRNTVLILEDSLGVDAGTLPMLEELQ